MFIAAKCTTKSGKGAFEHWKCTAEQQTSTAEQGQCSTKPGKGTNEPGKNKYFNGVIRLQEAYR